MTSSVLLPSLRARVGDWVYYVTTLTFREVTLLIQAPDQIHERKKLADWIQRSAIDTHSTAIANYITDNPQRFLGSLIVGVYGGAPNWTPVVVKVPEEQGLIKDQIENLEGKIGLLHLSGSENLFAIDGQHRVAGIKKALSISNTTASLPHESLSAIFVSHDPMTETGKQRTRRLFTTVNKKAKLVSKAARIALDEDDGFAIVTRRLIDSHWLFDDDRKHVLYTSGGSVPATDMTSITSVVGLFEIVRDLYAKPKEFETSRPSDDSLAAHLKTCTEFFDELLKQIPQYEAVFVSKKGRPGDYRQAAHNHFLFRPVGQRAFARGVQLLMSRGDTVGEAVKKLRAAQLFIQNEVWHYIVWNPVDQTMISTKLLLAEAQLLSLAGCPLRNRTIAQRLDELLASIADET